MFKVSCVSYREYKQVKFQAYESTLEEQSKVVYKMLIPKDYVEHRKLYGHGNEERFYYHDSIILYLSNDEGTNSLNYENIHKGGFSEEKFFFLADEKEGLTKLILEGEDNKGFFWKEFVANDITIGYINVPESRKKEFDSAIRSIKKNS